jgi:hypothetical protein
MRDERTSVLQNVHKAAVRDAKKMDDALLTMIEDLNGRVAALEGLVSKSLHWLEQWHDAGPIGESWQSDELEKLVKDARRVARVADKGEK